MTASWKRQSPRVVAAEARGAARLFVRYSDGVAGEVDLSGPIAEIPALARLKDPAFFAKAAPVDHGAAIGWPDDIDIDGYAQWLRLTGRTFP